MVGEGGAFVNMFVGANGVGKSAVGANIVANIIFGPQNEWFEFPFFQSFPYPQKKIRIISDPTTLKEKTIPELRKWFPSNDAKHIPDALFETAKEGKAYECKWITSNGWTIDLMSTEQDPKEFESVDLGFVWFDEPPPQSIYNATIARGRLGMKVIMTYTPLFHSAWLKDYIDQNADGKIVDYVEAEMEDNCKVHGARGILEHEYVQLMHDSYPEEEREARVYGKFGHLLGMVHPKYRRKVHVIRPYRIDPRMWTTYMALDPHPRVADHCMWLSINRQGTKIVTAEMLSTGGPNELAARILAVEAAMGFRIEDRIIDPSAMNQNQHDSEQRSLADQLGDHGLTFIGGSKDLMAGIKRTNQALDYEVREGKMVRPPELYVFDTCTITDKQITTYVWDEWKGRGRDEKKPLGRPRDKDDHMPENLHRLLLHEPQYVPWSARNVASVSIDQEDDDLDPYDKG